MLKNHSSKKASLRVKQRETLRVPWNVLILKEKWWLHKGKNQISKQEKQSSRGRTGPQQTGNMFTYLLFSSHTIEK